MNYQGKKIDNDLDKNTFLRFNQTLENYLKVSVGNDTYNLTKYYKLQMTDLTEIKPPKSDSDFFQKWKIINNNKNNVGKIGNFIKSTKSGSQTGYSGAESLTPIGNSFIYIEARSNNHGAKVFRSF